MVEDDEFMVEDNEFMVEDNEFMVEDNEFMVEDNEFMVEDNEFMVEVQETKVFALVEQTIDRAFPPKLDLLCCGAPSCGSPPWWSTVGKLTSCAP